MCGRAWLRGYALVWAPPSCAARAHGDRGMRDRGAHHSNAYRAPCIHVGRVIAVVASCVALPLGGGCVRCDTNAMGRAPVAAP
jgi:hypothetical protein